MFHTFATLTDYLKIISQSFNRLQQFKKKKKKLSIEKVVTYSDIIIDVFI